MGYVQTFRGLCGRFFLRFTPCQSFRIEKTNIAIIGLGKTGTAIGYLLRRAGYPVVAVASRSQASLRNRISYTGGTAFTADANAEAASLATCIFITTPDDTIAAVCRAIVQKGGIKPGDKVVHMSGAGGLDLLESARQAGAKVASIHPLQSFADIEGAIRNIPSSTFGITADEDLREWSAGLVRELGGIPVEVPEASQAPLPRRRLHGIELPDHADPCGRGNLSLARTEAGMRRSAPSGHWSTAP